MEGEQSSFAACYQRRFDQLSLKQPIMNEVPLNKFTSSLLTRGL